MASTGKYTKSVTPYNNIVFEWDARGGASIKYNTTSVDWELYLTSDGDAGTIYSTSSKQYIVTVNGQTYSGNNMVAMSAGLTRKTLAKGTTVIGHNADGTKTFSFSFNQAFNITFAGKTIGVVSGSGSGTLPTIARMSSLSAGNGTLGVSQTLSVTMQSSSFTHTISYQCGSASGTIATKSSALSIQWTPPLDLARQNTKGTSVSVVLTITTYNGTTTVGSKSVTISCAIPASIAPTVSATFVDHLGYLDRYGAFCQGLSQLDYTINAQGSYGSTITVYRLTVDGKVYTSQQATTDVLTGSGDLQAIISVTDSRNRTTTTTQTIRVAAYNKPTIKDLSAYRCDSSGIASASGEYLIVKAKGAVTFLGNYQARIILYYKKSTESSYEEDGINVYPDESVIIEDFQAILPAEKTSSYDIIVTIIDQFGNSIRRAVVGPSIKKVFSLKKKAGEIVGFAINAIAELDNVFDIGFQTRFLGGILHPVLPKDTDLDTLLKPNTYMMLTANTYINAPEDGIGGFLEIVGIEGTSVIQRYEVFAKSNPRTYERTYYGGTWGEWICTRGDFVVEQGESNGWYYRKWNSGVAECSKIVTVSTTIDTAWGSMYCGTTKMSRQNYPFGFVSKPTEVASLTAGSSAGWLYPEVGGNGVNGAWASAIYNVVRPTAVSTAVEFYIALDVRGKWK